MRYYLKFMIFIFLSLLFSANALAVSSENEAKGIDEFMQQFVYAYENRDLNTLMDFYASNAVIIGTGNDEIIKGKNEIREGFKKEFLQSSNATVEINRIALDVTSKYAFISYILNVNVVIPNQQPFQSKLRFSAVLVKHNQRWAILQSHLSAPLAGQKAGDSFPLATG